MSKQHKYTEEQIEFIKGYAYGHTREDIRVHFNEKFRTSLTYGQIANVMKRFKITNGIDSKFKKGMTPHNKGKKMTKEMYDKLRPTMFQKGHNFNARPVGSERIDVDGYIRVKVAQPNKWVLKHVSVWESYKGEVPKGKLVIFLDGNMRNFDINNLALISKAENLYLNTRKLRFDDRELTATAVNVAKINSKIIEFNRNRKEK